MNRFGAMLGTAVPVAAAALSWAQPVEPWLRLVTLLIGITVGVLALWDRWRP